jgi:uncharacterized protein (UPF0332 family)
VSENQGLGRAEQELAAARLLVQGGFAAQAVSRSYYAAFYAAEAALAEIGEVRSKHSGVVAATAQLLVGQHGLDSNAGRLLRSLFERRGHADYDLDETPEEEGGLAVADAAEVVSAIRRWFNARSAQGTAADGG